MSNHSDKYDVFMKMLEIIEQEQSVHLSVLSNEQKQKAKVVIEKLNIFQEQTFIENIEGDNVMNDKQSSEHKIEVLVGENATFSGDFVVADSIKNSFNKVAAADISHELKELLKELSIAVGQMSRELPKDEADGLAEDLGVLVEQSTQEKPKRKWWSVSVDGLTKAAENIGKIGQPVLELIGKIVPLLDNISV